MNTRTKYALQFAVSGFVIGPLLLAYAYYATYHYKTGTPNGLLDLLLILCPPSFASMALDSASKFEAITGWLISAENAALYGLIGFGIGNKVQQKIG
jgi:hypothetical protein